MNIPFRIVFAYCSDDPWIAGVADDLQKAAQILGHDLYVIAAGPHSAIEKNGYINVDAFQANYYFSRIIERMRYPALDLPELAERESLFVKHINPGSQESITEIKSRLHAWFAEAMLTLKIIQPDVVIVWNGLYERRAVYLRAAQHLKIPVYHAEKGMLPNSWYIDPQGVSVMSVIAEKMNPDSSVSGNTIDAFKKTLASIDEKGMSAWEQPHRNNLAQIRINLEANDNQKILFFPGQVDYDTNIVLFSKHFMSSLDALTWLVSELFDNEFYVLAKPHPKGNTSTADYEKVINGKGKVVPDINVIDAIELADCIVSINSTIAFEAAIRGKPVLLLGQGILCGRDYVSTYCPGKSPLQQVRECIERYNNNRDELYHQAVAFAAYLDSEYYAYRGDEIKSVFMLEQLEKAIGKRRQKLFEHNEVVAIFQDIPYEDFERSFLQKVSSGKMTNWFSARALVTALVEKIRNRCNL